MTGVQTCALPIFSLCVIQPLLKPTHYDLIDSFSLSIPLRICRGEISICYAQITAIPPESLTIKFQSVVRDKCMRDSKPSDNIFPNKFVSIRISDICQNFSFNPLGKVICTNQQISFIPCRFKEITYNVQSQLSKTPRTGQWVKDPS